MSHMQKMTTMELFVVAESSCGKTCFPADFIGISEERDLSEDELLLCDTYAESKVTEAEAVMGWFARMSAPGYMDSTDWCGPFDSEEKAIAHLEAMYEDDLPRSPGRLQGQRCAPARKRRQAGARAGMVRLRR